ncbi:diguanylate cyclase (GGDEF)-like protein [Rhizobium sp. BK529]|uniref:GGDEF domain-containing protein n=1 Tax=unclassified Rhizobium TaxID=2613769 RepID=UPI0010505148|nr:MULTISPECIES: GGDEF domain-containing protein [unclassified Rhizobium]MBB3592252.1 diguanylate cyclase (GGDEF)-like protein [Rhizobium sp. BK529]TCS06673.1 diguanylate cyclase (GGDEF)-like protein [Rhizobium sp. BK418]
MSLASLDEVERQLKRGFPLLRFSPEIETLFLRQYAAERARLIIIWCLIGLLIYDLVYFGDSAMVPDVLPELIVVRFAIFTPFVFGCIFAVRRWPNARFYDSLTVMAAVLSVTLPMIPAMKSTSQYLFVYQTYNSAAFLYFVISLRPRFRAVLTGLTLTSASHFTTTYLTGAFDQVAYFGIVTVYSMLSIFLAVSAYFLEKSDRKNFLNQLRASLLYRQLEEKAERDELTGLLNRRSLARISDDLWNGTTRQVAVSAILLDIDHFKRFNDVHGHIEGDACIRAVSQCIRDSVDPTSFVFRFGGEEMLVLLTGLEPAQVLATAERIRAAIEGLRIQHRGLGDGWVTASLGIASAVPAEIPLEKLLQKADEALYDAKRQGRNTVAVASRLEPRVA